MKKILLINGAILAAGVFILELGFGSWFSPHRLDQLNIVRHANYTFRVDSLYASLKKYARYQRDLYGLRGKYSDPAHIDILTMGGSATDQRYLDEGDTWQDVLHGRFRQNGSDVSVVNAGVDGQSTIGNLKDFEIWFPQIPNLKPRYVLVYLGPNDLFTDDRAAPDDVEGSHSIKAMLKSKSALHRLYRNLTGAYLASVAFPVSHRAISFSRLPWTHTPLRRSYEDFQSGRLARFEKRVRNLLATIRRWGAKPIVVTQPMRIYKEENGGILGVATPMAIDGVSVNGADIAHMLWMIHRKALDVCEDEGGIGLDLARQVNFTDDDFYDYVHNTPAGARKIGDYLYSRLKWLFAPVKV